MEPKKIEAMSRAWALTFARRLSLAHHIIDELAQEAAIGILRGLKKADPKKGNVTAYLRTWAFALMRAHVNKLGGPVGRDEGMPESVSIVSADEATPGYVDTRECRSLQHEIAEFREALSNTDDRTAAMVMRRIAGDTFEEIGREHGVSRQYAEILVKRFATAQASEAA